MDFAIINTTLLTFEPPGLGIIKNGTILVKNGIINFVGNQLFVLYVSHSRN